MMQTLTGDSTDGYSGCPGIGVKTAQKDIRRPRKCSPLRPMDASSSSLRQSWLLN